MWRSTSSGGTGYRFILAIGVAITAVVAVGEADARPVTLEGKVVAIADGDTLTLLDATKTQHKIRLQGIDAPEKGQAFGQRSNRPGADVL